MDHQEEVGPVTGLGQGVWPGGPPGSFPIWFWQQTDECNCPDLRQDLGDKGLQNTSGQQELGFHLLTFLCVSPGRDAHQHPGSKLSVTVVNTGLP